MPKLYPIKNNFTGGLVSSLLHGRPDLRVYQNGLRQCDNFIVLPHGGITRRSGFTPVASVKIKVYLAHTGSGLDDMTLDAAFSASTDTVYKIEIDGNGTPDTLKWYKDGVLQASNIPLFATLTVEGDVVVNFAATVGHTIGDYWEFGRRKARLIPFVFSEDPTQSYVLEFGHEYMRVYQGATHGQVAGPYEIATPYLSSDIDNIRYAQSADVMYLVDGRNDPRKLTRSAHNSWSLDTFSTSSPPWVSFSTLNPWIISFLPLGGAIPFPPTDKSQMNIFFDISRDGMLFTKQKILNLFPIPLTSTVHEGTLGAIAWGNPAHDYDDVPTEHTYITTALGGIYTNFAWKVTGTLKVAVTGSYEFGINSADTADLSIDAETPLYLLRSNSGPANATGAVDPEDEFTSRGTVTLTAGVEYPITVRLVVQNGGGSNEYGVGIAWKPPAIADLVLIPATNTDNVSDDVTADLPRTVTIFQDRLWFGGSPNNPQTIWSSKTSHYEDFAVGDEDDDGIRFTIASQQIDPIRWLKGARRFLVGTSSTEYVVGGSGGAITPSDIEVLPNSFYGSKFVDPAQPENSIIFVGRAGSTLRDYFYRFKSDGYEGDDQSVMSYEEIAGGVKELVYQQAGLVGFIDDWSLVIPQVNVLWILTDDRELKAVTYEKKHKVIAWHKHTLGATTAKVDSIAVIPGAAGDELWAIVSRKAGAVLTDRYVEYLNNTAKRDNDGGANEEKFTATAEILPLELQAEGQTSRGMFKSWVECFAILFGAQNVKIAQGLAPTRTQTLATVAAGSYPTDRRVSLNGWSRDATIIITSEEDDSNEAHPATIMGIHGKVSANAG